MLRRLSFVVTITIINLGIFMAEFEELADVYEQWTNQLGSTLPQEPQVLGKDTLNALRQRPGNTRFFEPLEEVGIRGRSRRHADIEPEKQLMVASKILDEATKRGYPDDMTAVMLATADIESGFNPDAAAPVPQSSASGLFQITGGSNALARKAGLFNLKGSDFFDVDKAIQAGFTWHESENMRDAKRFMKRDGKDWNNMAERAKYLYLAHHEGGSWNGVISEDLARAVNVFMQRWNEYYKVLQGRPEQKQVTAMNMWD